MSHPANPVVGGTPLPKPTLPNPNALDAGGIKVSAHIQPEPREEELRHLQQMGVTHCYAWVSEEQCNVPFLTALRESVESYGLTLWNAGCMRWAKNKDHILGTDKRDEGIAGFQQMLRDLSASGIHITTFTWEPDGVWSTPKAITRGNVETRAADARLLAADTAAPKHGREYTVEEIWDNLEVFLKAVVPVAEGVGVKLSLHPNDPPVNSIAGVPCLITSKAAYDRAYAIAGHSPILGMEFCCGCWLEGGQISDGSAYHPGFGNIYEALPAFIEEKKVNIVHFRNITSPLPAFDESFIDDGYGDMYLLIRNMVAANYDGSIILDHTPSFEEFAGGHAGATSFAVGWIKGAIRAAQFELKFAAAAKI